MTARPRRPRSSSNAEGVNLGGVFPHRDYFPATQQTDTIADISGGFNEEVYVLLNSWERGGETVSFHVYINPLINWVWVGGLVMMAGFRDGVYRLRT